MTPMAVVFRFNGTDLPPEMANLSPGQYVVERLDEAPALTADEDRSLSEALLSLREGEGVDVAELCRRIEAILGRGSALA